MCPQLYVGVRNEGSGGAEKFFAKEIKRAERREAKRRTRNK